MKPSARKTLNLKSTQCQYCKSADKIKMRQGRDYCPNIDGKNGHCINFQPEKEKGGMTARGPVVNFCKGKVAYITLGVWQG